MVRAIRINPPTEREPVDQIYRIIGTKIREARIRALISQGDFAAMLGVNASRVCALESGVSRTPLELIYLAAVALDLEPQSVFPSRQEAGL